MKSSGLAKPGAIKVVSWDVDGTLYSLGRMKRRLIGLLVWEVVRGRGLAALAELAALQRYRARIDAARAAGGDLGGVLQGTDRQALVNLERRWYSHAIRQTGPRTGLTKLLEFFAASEIPQVAFSDYQAEYKLESLGLEERFASIYAGEHLGFVKPSPKGFERIAIDFKVPTASLLHIGDRAETDGAGARAAGCQYLILGQDFHSFAALARELRTLSWG